MTMQSEALLAKIWRFLHIRKKGWLLPAILMMALFGGLIVVVQSNPGAPFLYGY